MTNIIDLSKIKAEQQTEELCLMAIQQDPYNLKYIASQTEEMCLLAVNNNGSALKHVKNKTKIIESAAFKNTVYAVQYIEKPSNKMCMDTIKKLDVGLLYLNNIDDHILIYGLYNLNKINVSNQRLCKEIVKDVLNKKIENFLFNEFKKIYLKKSLKLNNSNPLTICAEIISNQPDDYVLKLRSKIPKIFEKNEELNSVYQKVILNKNINSQININRNPKKF